MRKKQINIDMCDKVTGDVFDHLFIVCIVCRSSPGVEHEGKLHYYVCLQYLTCQSVLSY